MFPPKLLQRRLDCILYKQTILIYFNQTAFINIIVFVSTQEKGTKEQQDNLQSEKAFVRTEESVWSKNKDYMGGATCWSSILLYNQYNCTIF